MHKKLEEREARVRGGWVETRGTGCTKESTTVCEKKFKSRSSLRERKVK